MHTFALVSLFAILLLANGQHHSNDGHNGPVVFPDSPNRTEYFPSGLRVRPTAFSSSADTRYNYPKIPLAFLKKLTGDTSIIFRKYVRNIELKLEKDKIYLVNTTSKMAIKSKSNNNLAEILNEEMSNQEIRGHTRTQQNVSDRIKVPPQKITKHASCQPDLSPVDLALHFDPHIIYYPRCIRLERCGGCCNTDILNCEPTSTMPVEIVVNKFAYIGDDKDGMNFLEQESITMEQHTKCECKCRVKETDCSPRHIYKEDECQCVCRNQDQHDTCHHQQIWDSKTCECSCREIKDCNSGLSFNLRTCQCESPAPVNSNSNRRGRRKRQH